MYSIWGEWHISNVTSLEALLEYIYMEEKGVLNVYMWMYICRNIFTDNKLSNKKTEKTNFN